MNGLNNHGVFQISQELTRRRVHSARARYHEPGQQHTLRPHPLRPEWAANRLTV